MVRALLRRCDCGAASAIRWVQFFLEFSFSYPSPQTHTHVEVKKVAPLPFLSRCCVLLCCGLSFLS